MSGTPSGGLLAAKTNKERHGDDFYKKVGQLGGQKSRGGGFTGDPERARAMGSKGGSSKHNRCAKGHLYTPDNELHLKYSKRRCKVCYEEWKASKKVS